MDQLIVSYNSCFFNNLERCKRIHHSQSFFLFLEESHDFKYNKIICENIISNTTIFQLKFRTVLMEQEGSSCGKFFVFLNTKDAEQYYIFLCFSQLYHPLALAIDNGLILSIMDLFCLMTIYPCSEIIFFP